MKEQIKHIKTLYEKEANVQHNFFMSHLLFSLIKNEDLKILTVGKIEPDLILSHVSLFPGTVFITDLKMGLPIGHVSFVILTDCPGAVKINTAFVDEKYRRQGIVKNCIASILENVEFQIEKPHAIISDIDGESDNFYKLLLSMGARPLEYKNAFGLNMLAYSNNDKFNYSTLKPKKPNELDTIQKRSEQGIQYWEDMMNPKKNRSR
jgi:hypothetical protein